MQTYHFNHFQSIWNFLNSIQMFIGLKELNLSYVRKKK